MATKYTREWTEFFTGSGIPIEAATTYALIFYENRIQKNMLLDLNKEYLRDMGITVMGDVIAILRYAKLAYKKYMSEEILVEKNESSLDCKSKSMLADKSMSLSSNKKQSVSLPIEETIPEIKVHSLTNAKKNIQWNKLEFKNEKGGLQTPKIRRALPEYKTGYKIKIPSVGAERSMISEQIEKKETKTVFDRLGESSVSSTTSEITPVNSVLNNLNSGSSSANKSKTLSVFSRLGDKTVSVVSSTSSYDKEHNLIAENVSTPGISQSEPSNKRNLMIATMRADNEEQKTTRNNSVKLKGIPVKKRLGMTKDDSNEKLNSWQKRERLGGVGTIKSKLYEANNVVTQKEGIKSRLNTQQVVTTGKKAQMLNGVERVKRKLETDSMRDNNSSKKVRFGSTTLKLIPSTLNSTERDNSLQNREKLTMILNNKNRLSRNPSSLSGFRTISKPLQGRLFKRAGGIITDVTTTKKRRNICDRLG